MIHLVADAQRQARIRARLGDDAVERGRSSTGQKNVGFIGEFPPGDSPVGGKAMSLSERKDQPACGCELDVPARPPKQGRLELFLQPPNLLAQGRLRDVETRGRPAEVQLFSDGNEVPKVSKLHRAAIS